MWRFIVLQYVLGECSGNAIQSREFPTRRVWSMGMWESEPIYYKVVFFQITTLFSYSILIDCLIGWFDRHSDSSGISASLNTNMRENMRRAVGTLIAACLIHATSYSFRVFPIPFPFDSSRTRITSTMSITSHQVCWTACNCTTCAKGERTLRTLC